LLLDINIYLFSLIIKFWFEVKLPKKKKNSHYLYILMSHKTIQTFSVEEVPFWTNGAGCYLFDFYSKNGEQQIKKTQGIIHIKKYIKINFLVRPFFFLFLFFGVIPSTT